MPADSTRFLVQNIMNILICNYASKKIYKEAISRSGKKTLNYYLIFILFAIAMIILNQLVFFYFKPRNLYEEL